MCNTHWGSTHPDPLTPPPPTRHRCVQVESTLSMQAMQPKVKALQAKYANDPERLQVGAGGIVLFGGGGPRAVAAVRRHLRSQAKLLPWASGSFLDRW